MVMTQTEAWLMSGELRTAARELCSRTDPNDRIAGLMREMAEALGKHEDIQIRSANGPRVARAVGQTIRVMPELPAWVRDMTSLTPGSLA